MMMMIEWQWCQSDSKTCRSPPPTYQHSMFTCRVAFLSPNQRRVSKGSDTTPIIYERFGFAMSKIWGLPAYAITVWQTATNVCAVIKLDEKKNYKVDRSVHAVTKNFVLNDVRSVCGSWPSGISVAILYDTFERSDLQKNCDLLIASGLDL